MYTKLKKGMESLFTLLKLFERVCVVASTSTLHGVLQWGKALGALVKAAPFV